jgi:hypothetical protein
VSIFRRPIHRTRPVVTNPICKMRFLYPALVSLSLSSLPALVFAENVVFLNNGLVGDKDVLDKLQARSSKHEAKGAFKLLSHYEDDRAR